MTEPEPTPSPAIRAPRARSLPTPGSRRAVVIGAGSFGTALAVLLTRGGLRTTLQARTAEQARRVRHSAVQHPFRTSAKRLLSMTHRPHSTHRMDDKSRRESGIIAGQRLARD